MIITTSKETNRVASVQTSSPELEAQFIVNNPTMNSVIVDNGFIFTEDPSLYELVNGQLQLIADWKTVKAEMISAEQRSEIENLETRLAELKELNKNRGAT
jgi:hypothetical protein